MTDEERYVARILFMNKVYAASGQAYEDLLTHVLRLAIPGFRPVKPQGRLGDRKNDGFVPDSGSYWQVYSPENPAARIAEAIEKLATDFQGLKDYWGSLYPIREYNFAFNDKYSGAYPELERALVGIRDSHGLQRAEPFYAQHLENHLLGLPRSDIISVVGVLPSPQAIEGLDYDALSEVLAFIYRERVPFALNGALVVPDFNEKIVFNELGTASSRLLHHGAWQVAVVEDFFSRNGDFVRAHVRDILANLYSRARTAALGRSQSDVSVGDQIYFDLLQCVTPGNDARVQEAAIVLLSYFFESCDIFEETPRS